jgi:hypothetical protein
MMVAKKLIVSHKSEISSKEVQGKLELEEEKYQKGLTLSAGEKKND